MLQGALTRRLPVLLVRLRTSTSSSMHDGARIMTMPAIRSNPLIPSTSVVSSHHGTQTHTVQTSQFHDSECKDADFDLSSTDSDHDDDDQLKNNKGCYDRRVFSTAGFK